MPTRRSMVVMMATATALIVTRSSGRAEPIGLRALADSRGLNFGSAIDPALLGDVDYRRLVEANCNIVLARNGLKWSATERTPGTFDLAEGDRVVQFAQEREMAVRGHTLVWHNLPKWVEALRSPEDVIRAIKRHVDHLVSHFAGQISSWDVVNEPFEYDTDQLRASVFHKVLGEEYIDIAFKAARSADPAAELVLNETHISKFGETYAAKRAALLALVDRLLERQVPIDAVGVQGHFRPGLDTIDREGFGRFCADLADRNLSVLITELDASCRFIHAARNFSDTSYADIFRDIVLVAAEHGRLSSVTLWGLSPFGLEPNERPDPNPKCLYTVNPFSGDLLPEAGYEGLRSALERL